MRQTLRYKGGILLHEAKLGLVLKVKPFKIFTAIHNSKIFVRSEDRAFNYEPIFDCLHFNY